MDNYTNFTPRNLDKFRKELKELFDLHEMGVEFEIGKMTYSDTNVVFKVECNIEGSGNRSTNDAKQYADMFGIKMENSRGMKIVGYKRSASKYPWIYTKASGARFKTSDEEIRRMFAV